MKEFKMRTRSIKRPANFDTLIIYIWSCAFLLLLQPLKINNRLNAINLSVFLACVCGRIRIGLWNTFEINHDFKSYKNFRRL